MKYAKKEKFYVNSLNTPEPTKEVIPKKESVDLRPFEEIKKEIYTQRLFIMKGNVFKAAASLKVNRNAFFTCLGQQVVDKVRQDLKNKEKEEFLHTLKAFQGNLRVMANRLKVSHSSLINKANKYGLRTRQARVDVVKLVKPKQLDLFKD